MKTSFVFHCIKVLATAALMLISLCAQALEKRTLETIQPGATLHMEIEQSDSATLCWDPPAMYADSVDSYELFYRPQHDSGLTSLKSIPASPNPSVTLHRNEVDPTDSVFYFSVRSVAKSGLKSDFNASADSDAVPTGGWFMLWKPK
jgi:hypothetical protein